MDASRSRIFDIPLLIRQKYGGAHHLFLKRAPDGIASTTVDDFIEKANSFSGYLIEKGLKKGDKVVTIINNSPEWNIAETGILQAGGIHVPLSFLYSNEQLKNILKIVHPAWVFTSSQTMTLRLQAIAEELSIKCHNRNIKTDAPFDFGYSDKMLDASKQVIDEHEPAVILFTSGSAGLPKGVALSHKNVMSSINEFSGIDVFKECKRYISFLQLCQSAERKVNYSCQLNGITVCYPASHKTMLSNIWEFEPQITALVPFLLNELHHQLISSDAHQMNIRKIICGGASVPIERIRQFKQKGVNIFEVYGLTETASLLTYNTERNNKVGTVGKIADTVKVLISNEREVLVKGENVMKGYLLDNFKLDPARDEEGWFHTGDIGEIDEEGFLKITGRKKSAFKNSRGSYVYPEEIEKELMRLLIFDQAVVSGDNADSLSAIFKLKEPVQKDEVKANQICELIRQFNIGKNDELKIARFMLLHGKNSEDLFSVSMKLDRRRVAELINNGKFISVY